MSFELTASERHSALWAKLLQHFEAKRATARAKNDGPDDAIVTAHRRGQISIYTMLIAMNDEPSIPD